MRDFFISAFESLIAVIIVLIALGVLVGAAAATMQDGPIAGIAVLVGGTLYTIIVGGMLYMVFGIYHNTRRTAEACERMLGAGNA